MNLALDANIIIESYVFGVWPNLIEKNRIIVTDTVLAEVDHFRDPTTGDRKRIDKPGDVIPFASIINPDRADLIAVTALFNDLFLESIDPGEREIIALAYANKLPEDTYICSADVPAIEALASIDKMDMGISFEDVLRRLGLTKDLSASLGAYTEASYRRAVERGAIAKIQRTHFKR